jgi:ABC-type uncharacterized transport system permease subunit
VVTLAFVVTALAYAVASALYLAHLARGHASAVTWAPRALGAAITSHAAFVAFDFALAGRVPTGDIRQALALLSLVIALAYLATMRRHRMTVLGAFLTPVALLLFLGAGLGASVPAVPENVRSALLPLHVGVNVLGIAAFALAFAAAVGYLVQERLLRQKRVIGVFQRLPALDVLDAFGLKLVTFGFPLFTVGLVTGSLWAARRAGSMSVTTGQGFAMLAWLCFGAVLLARAAAGWRGRRAAIGTLFGFACAMAALIGYLVRDGGG